MTTDYNDRIEQAAADSADVIDNLTALLRRLGTLAEKAGVERPGYLAPADLVAAISARVDILSAKAAAHNATLAEGLRTIGYNDTEIEQCLADVPDLTMADIDYARTFAAEVWDESRATYSYGNYVRDAQLRIMPKVDYSAVTQAVAIFQGLTNIEYFPTLDWPNVTTAGFPFHNLAKLHRMPQVNAPEVIVMQSLYSTNVGGNYNRLLPKIINHPKAKNVHGLYANLSPERLAEEREVNIDFSKVTNAAQLFQVNEGNRHLGIGPDHFPITELTAEAGVNMQQMYDFCTRITGGQSHVKWNVPNATNLMMTFREIAATAIDVTGIRTANCTNFGAVFGGCANLRSLDLSTWDMSSGENLRDMFIAAGIEVLDFSHKRFKEGADLVALCEDMPRLRELILTDVDFTNTADQTNIDAYFYELPSLETIIGPVSGLHNTVYLADSPLLTVESAMVIINGLADITDSGRTLGLYLHASAYNRLTPEQIAVATSKGWRVVKNA